MGVQPMPFLLYEIEAEREFLLVRPVSLAGKQGPIASHVRATCPNGGGWHLSETTLLERLGVQRPGAHAVIIDIAPDRRDEALLCRIRDVWGFTYRGWTPILLRLEVVYDDVHENPSQMKPRFPVPDGPGDLVHEFLYLRGGTTAQAREWTWGRTGQVNAALLWADALEFFIAAINSSQ
jgi:hypothetical protein